MDSTLIPVEGYCPIFPSNLAMAPASVLANCYVKRPSLTSYQASDPYQISERVLKEA